MKRTILSALLAATAVLSVAAPAFADRWHHHYYHHYHRGYYAPPPVVYAPPPPPPVYAGPSFNITIPLHH
jgi:hypothetical protein